MATKEELQAKHSAELAAFCGRIAKDSSIDSGMRDEALALETQWILLQKPSNPDLNEQRKIEAEKAAQKSRMVHFLLMF